MNYLQKRYCLLRLIDHRNRQLWKDLNQEYTITLSWNDEPNYSVFNHGKQATIYIQRDKLLPGSFTHELLHLYLIWKGVAASRALFQTVLAKNPDVEAFLSEGLIVHMVNTLDHLKMFPLFLELGYEPQQFLSDYSVDKGADQYIEPIVSDFRVGDAYSKTVVDDYIGRYFAIIACPNPDHSYSIALNTLRSVDPGLYAILSKFAAGWWSLDYPTESQWHEARIWVVYQFTDELSSWTTGKLFK